jgi:hypothetical protein
LLLGDVDVAESLMLSLGGGISGAAHVPLGKRSIRVDDDVAVALMERVVTGDTTADECAS